VATKHVSVDLDTLAARIMPRNGRRSGSIAVSSPPVTARHIRHDLFIYDTDDVFAAQLARYLVAGVEAGERLMVVVGVRKQAIVRAALGADAESIAFADPTQVYARPEAALAQFNAVVGTSSHPSDLPIRAYGEPPARGTRAEQDRWISYESIINRALAGRVGTLMCGYDARITPARVLREMRRAHRVVLDGAWQLSPDYEEPEVLVRELQPSFEPLTDLRPLELGEPAQLQDRLAHELSEASMPDARARDMLVAAREVLSNAERYGRGVRSLRVGQVGEHIVCEVTDAGPGLDDPLAGYVPPRQLGDDPAGLWIARQLTSRLELSSEAAGLTVRLWGSLV
jgi:anti-sigma regulatory factor (Ser/Thr protein kinase)